MSDFFEMRAMLDRKNAEKREKKLCGRVYQAIVVMLLCGAVGLHSGIRDLEQPVGYVTEAFSQQKQLVVTFTPNP
jgi:hypothetical protein